ncbi:MAG: YggS family pyridoxal phosphate-dependent enzyme [Pseudomonadota bacterium]
MTIATNLGELQQQIAELTAKYHRPPHCVQLLAVSKNQTSDAIATAYAAGQRAFGENYLQEALTKISELKKFKIEWHFIGAIQSNKTKKLAEHFAWIHTVDNLSIAERLNKQRPENLPPLNICLQVNISRDPNKAGCDPENILALAQACQKFSRLNLRGLMTIPLQNNSFTAQRAEFHKMFELFQKLAKNGLEIDTLSMGMSDDLEAAIAEGSTMLRIGTKIFGVRF